MEKVACEVASPCVRSCCLDNADICLGCYRSLDEILSWSKAPAEEKRAILARTGSRRQLNKNQPMS